jgi:hypothetical protein
MGLGPFEHRPAPSQNPLPRNQQTLEPVLALVLPVATDQLNYTIVM